MPFWLLHPLRWFKASLRSFLGRSLLGRLFQTIFPTPQPQNILLVCATRLTEKSFWKQSALGRSLKPWVNDARVSVNIKFNNSDGLPKIYNQHLRGRHLADVILFVHDDVWLDDPEWIAKVLTATHRFDVVGVAGNTRRSRNQPAWLFSKLENDQFTQDHAHLSGAIGHGQLSKGKISEYGPSPARCELLAGMFLAVNSHAAIESQVQFDELFDFNFYDMDFCRSARRAGMSVGTWPIALTHQSGGSFPLNPKWQEGHARYFVKWKH